VALTQQELEARLRAAANSLRGPVDPSDFKAYIFPLLFFKRISDVWDEERERAINDFGDALLRRNTLAHGRACHCKRHAM
jgi:type I restriction enzyme M protein